MDNTYVKGFLMKDPLDRQKELENRLVEYFQSVVEYKKANNSFYGGLSEKVKPGYYRDTVYSADSLNANRLEKLKNEKCEEFFLLFEYHLRAINDAELQKKEVWHFLDACTELMENKIIREHDTDIKNILPLSPIKSYETKYLMTEAIGFLGKMATKYPLASQDKFSVLEYIVANKYHQRTSSKGVRNIDDNVLLRLVSVNPHSFEQQFFDVLHDRTIRSLNEKTKNNSKEIATFFEMFKCFEKNIKLVSDETVAEYANLYFLMSDKSRNELDISVLKNLATKTTKAVKKAHFYGEQEVLDKTAIKNIFATYMEYVNKSGGFNERIANQMVQLAGMAFETEDYSVGEVKEILNIIRDSNVTGAGKSAKRAGIGKLYADVANQARGNLNIYNNPLTMGYNSMQQGEPDDFSKLRYAEFLFKRAKSDNSDGVKINGLGDLLIKDGKIDKQLVLGIAEAYGRTYTADEMENLQYNDRFHDKMTKMLQHIVVEHDYNDDEVRELTNIVSKGAEGTYAVVINSCEGDMENYGTDAAYSEKRGHYLFQRMAQLIENAYAPVCDREDRHKDSASKTISPIVLKKISGGNNK